MEPGRDGVGDYTRILAASLIKLGNSVTAISLNDDFVFAESSELQNCNGIDLPVIRIPKNWSHKKSFEKGKEWLTVLNPDWISIQFVIFAFDNKGLPFYVANYLSRLVNGRKCHFMFHELWVGIHTNTSIKYFLWGWLQKQIILKLIKKIKPSLVSTQTKLYQQILLQHGINAGYLALFGNIPVVESVNINKDFMAYKIINLVLFGTIHAEAPVEKFIKELQFYCLQLQINFTLTIVGRTGKNIEGWINIFYALGVNFVQAGEQSPRDISEILSKAAIGISTTPIAFAEKSGTIAAMREHGLPVICVASSTEILYLNNILAPDGIYKYEPGNLKLLMDDIHKSPRHLQVVQIALQLEEAFIRNN